MDRLLQLDTERFVREMLVDAERALRKVAEEVNHAPDGNVINGSEIPVRDLMDALRDTAYEKAVQMRIDSTESSFSPSQGRVEPAQTQQGPLCPDGSDDQRKDRDPPDSLVRRPRAKRHTR